MSFRTLLMNRRYSSSTMETTEFDETKTIQTSFNWVFQPRKIRHLHQILFCRFKIHSNSNGSILLANILFNICCDEEMSMRIIGAIFQLCFIQSIIQIFQCTLNTSNNVRVRISIRRISYRLHWSDWISCFSGLYWAFRIHQKVNQISMFKKISLQGYISRFDSYAIGLFDDYYQISFEQMKKLQIDDPLLNMNIQCAYISSIFLDEKIFHRWFWHFS